MVFRFLLKSILAVLAFLVVAYVALIFILGPDDSCYDHGGRWLKEYKLCDYGNKERCLEIGGKWIEYAQACK